MTILEQGSCGAAAAYTVYENEGRLTVVVEGTGAMQDYSAAKYSPFHKYRDRIYEIDIKKGITGIGDRAFKECENLREVKLPAGLQYLGSEALQSCIMLETVIFRKGFEILSPKALEKNVSLRKVTFPSTFRAIDFKVFNGCTALEKITYRGSAEQWKKCVRVSPSARGNAVLDSVKFNFSAESSEFSKLCAKLGSIARRGGDGKLHVAAPNLTSVGAKGKSGDLTFIVFPDGQTMMIDAGAPFCEERVLNFVKALKIQNLDYFVLTHPHGDHYGCALAAVKHLSEKKNGCVRRFLYTGYKAAKDEFKALLDYLSDKGTEMNTHVREGDKFDVGGVRIDVFNPDDAVLAVDTKGDDVVNNTSISMKFTFGEASFIASGDLYAGRERALAEKYGDFLRADFIKSNHHGLFTSNTAEWIAAACPKYILTEDDGADWTLFEDRLKKQKIRHFRVSEKGLVCATVSRDGKYRFSTEY